MNEDMKRLEDIIAEVESTEEDFLRKNLHCLVKQSRL